MVRLIFSIVFLIILAVFIAFNARFTTDMSLFGHELTAVPTVAVVLLALVAGVLYSFGLYLLTYFAKRRAVKVKELKRQNAEKERALKTKEQELESVKSALPQPESPETFIPGEFTIGKGKKKTSGIAKPFGRKARSR